MKKDIILINAPDYNERRRLQPLGIGYIAAYLEKNGILCDLLDANSDKPAISTDSIVKKVLSESYEIIGISVTKQTFKNAIKIAEEIKKTKSVCIVLGGYHPSNAHEEILANYSCVDIISRGEGEITFYELEKAIKGKCSLYGIKGISYRDKDNSIVINENRDLISDINTLPFPKRCFPMENNDKFYDEEEKREKNVINISSSRGCPHRCNFCSMICSEDYKGNIWRARDAKSIKAEIVDLMEKGVIPEHIFFSDDNFLVDFDRACEILKAIREVVPKMTFSLLGRADQVVRKADRIKNLKEYGCKVIELGVESGSDNCLKRMNKGTTVAINSKAIDILNSNGIRMMLDFIFFEPYMNLNDIEDNIVFLKEKGLWGYYQPVVYSSITLYAGSQIYESLKSEGRVLGDIHDPTYHFLDEDVENIYRKIMVFATEIQPDISKIMDQFNGKFVNVFNENLPLDITLSLAKFKIIPYKMLEAIYEDEKMKDGKNRVDKVSVQCDLLKNKISKFSKTMI